MSPEVARCLLSLDFRQADRERLEELNTKDRAGTLTPGEKDELDRYRHITQLLDRMRNRARQVLAHQAGPSTLSMVIPPGIKSSQDALCRDLPTLLKNKKLYGRWVAYHGDERIGIAHTQRELIEECLRRGLPDNAYYIGVIEETELIEEEEIASRSFVDSEEIGPGQPSA